MSRQKKMHGSALMTKKISMSILIAFLKFLLITNHRQMPMFFQVDGQSDDLILKRLIE